ncbi:hypothetical protein FM102_07160 [Corynebacterium glutamicum]|uniref:hypothetical protein n=1 Tax=Corynebacterium glutamicum TaxID=1718 RepID=UPI00097F4981|nr:hypothetical protein [Corynebacterium glutamicum]SJM58523.1 hypothetical protein FM102_07160 [Corynebacterium glutamicum]
MAQIGTIPACAGKQKSITVTILQAGPSPRVRGILTNLNISMMDCINSTSRESVKINFSQTAAHHTVFNNSINAAIWPQHSLILTMLLLPEESVPPRNAPL